jgi:fumarate reductase flavoprotein subunit
LSVHKNAFMNNSQPLDLIVIGGGIAGLTAANRAAQLGLRALVLEQGSADKYLCNTRYTGGTLHVCMREIMEEPAALTRAIVDASNGFVSETLASTIAIEGRRVVRWLQDEGMRFMKASGAAYHRWVLAPPGRSRPGLDWEGRAGDVLLRTLGENLAKRGGAIQRGMRAQSLILENSRCCGVIASGTNGTNGEVRLSARAVVIADGGFQGNADLVRQYICAQPERLKQRGAGTGRGDGLRMASAAGAKLLGLDRFYGHLLSRDALTNDQLWPYPYLDTLATAGIIAGADGARFVDEGRGGVYIANAITKIADPLSAFVVFDHSIWEGPGRNGLIAPNPHLPAVGGAMIKAESLDALAQAMDVPAATLKQTVQAYNAAHASGALLSLTPPRRTTAKYQPMPIAQAPYYAAPLCTGITNTMGGIAINEHAQALREDGSIIEGLYAAGAATGGLEGGPEVEYTGGLVKGGVTGLRAAEHIAQARAG